MSAPNPIGNTPEVYNPPPIRASVAPPDLSAWAEMLVAQVFNQLNCHQVGTVTAFYPATQTADIQIGMQRLVPQGGETPSWVATSSPILPQVPCIFLGGGGCSLTFPVAAGDTCLLFFNDRDIGNWFTTGVAATPPPSNRAHHISDAIALVGLRNLANLLPSVSTTDAVLQNEAKGSQIALGTHIRIANSTASMLTILNDILSILTSINTAGFGGTNHSLTGAIATAQTQTTALFKT